MHATMLSGVKDSNMVNKSLSAMGRDFTRLAANTGQWQTVSKRVNDQTVQLTDNLLKQKATYKDIAAARKSGLLEMARQEQLRLRNAQVSTLGRTPAGQNYAQMMIPSAVTDGMDTMAKKIGFQSALLKSASTQMVNFGKNTQWAGRQLMVGFTLPLVAAGAATGYFAYQADKALTRVAKVYDTTVNDNLSLVDQQMDREKQLAQLRVDGMNTAKNAAKAFGASMQDTLATQGDLAATGQKGMELQKATTQTMRLATLGEMDYQTATQASITLQSVFRQNSEDLTKTFNYMNAVENQTSLSMQDFAVAIPIAAAPIKALGGSVQDLGTLLVAMKSRGIDAAEGANAIKSSFTRLLNPSKMVQAQFKEMTGKDIVKLVESTKGELIPTFKALGESVENLDKLGKARVLGKLFGTYQNTRINAMMTGITEDMDDASTQVGRAVELAHANDAKLAGIADSELKQVQNSASGRLKIAVETIKVDLAEMGQGFLESAVKILNGAENIIEAFKKLPGPVKGFLKWMVIITAAIGPLAMLTGLFFNMVGTVGRAAGSLGMLLTRFKLLNRDSVLAEKAAAAATTAMDRQTQSVESLATAIAGLNEQLLMAARNNGALLESTNTAVARKGIANQTQALKDRGARVNQSTGNVSMPLVSKDGRTRRTNITGDNARLVKNADYRWTNNGGVPFASVNTIDQAHAEANRINAGKNAMALRRETEAQVKATEAAKIEEQKRAQAINASKIGAGLLTASLVASLVPLGEGNETSANIKKNIVQWGLAVGLFLPIIGNANRALAVARATSGSVGAAFAGSKAVQGVKTFGVGLAAAATSTGTLSGGIKGVTKYLAGGKGLLNPWVLGLTAAAAGAFMLYKHLGKATEQAKKLNDDASGLAKIFGFTEIAQGTKVDPKTGATIKTLTEQVKELNKEYPSLADNIHNAGSEQSKFNAASFQGMKAFNAGASVEQSKAIVHAALVAAEGIAGAEKIEMKFKYDPADLSQQIATINSKISSGISDTKAIHWNPRGDYGKSSIQAGAKSLAAVVQKNLDSGDVAAAQTAIEQVVASFNKGLSGKRLQEKSKAAEELLNAYADAIGTNKKGKDAIQDAIVNQFNALDKSPKKINLGNFLNLDPTGIFKRLKEVKQGVKDWQDELASSQNDLSFLTDPKYSKKNQNEAIAAMLKGKKLTSDQKDILEALRNATDLRLLTEKEISSVLGEQNSKLSNQANDTKYIASSRKTLISGIQGIISGLDKQDTSESAALDRRQKASSDAMDAANRRREALFDKQQTAMENRQEREQHNFDKAWDARIKKEEDVEKLRQKMFDAERNRIQRLAELQNANIDFNAALQSGHLDEAAKIQNTQAATTQSNNLDDADKALGDAADARLDALQKQRDDEAYTLKRHQEFEKQAFEATKKRYEDQQAAAKAAAEAGFQVEKDNLAKAQAARKANLEKAITDINNFHGTSLASWQAFLAKEKTKFGGFSGSLGKLFQTAMDKVFAKIDSDAEKLADPRKWGPKGADAYQGWMDGTSKAAKAHKAVSEVKDALKHIFAGFANHEGGMAFSGRTGYPSGAAPYPSEHLRLLKNDEYVMKGSAVRAYGKATFDHMNKAKPSQMQANHEGGIAGATTTVGQIPMQAYTAQLFASASALNKRQAALASAGGGKGIGAGASMAGVDPKGWNKPWKGHYTTNNGHDYPLVYKPIYAPHSGKIRTHAIKGYEPRVAHGGHGFRSYGQWIDFDGGGTNLMFAHLSKLPASPGSSYPVRAGDYIGTTGETGNAHGPHVHVERNHTGDNGQFGAFFRQQHVSLRKGGTLKYDNTMVQAHKGETVLTDNLTQKFKKGMEELANGGHTEYNVNVTLTGSATKDDADRLAEVVMKRIKQKESRKGTGR